MKFVQLTETNGTPVYIGESMIVSAVTAAIRPVGTLIRTQMGQQEVSGAPAVVVAMLEAL